MHTLLDLKGNIPSFIHVSDGKLHDVHALDLLALEAGAIYVMDRGHVDFDNQLNLFAFYPDGSSDGYYWVRAIPTGFSNSALHVDTRYRILSTCRIR